jgi:beta-mannosidase
MIPPDEMEGRYSAAVLQRQVQSAVDAGMNMLRVWGGGVFLPDAFYDACDELGILLYHDMQFAQEGHSPDVTPTEEAEFRHQVRRLSHHPSLALIDGCNECRE